MKHNEIYIDMIVDYYDSINITNSIIVKITSIYNNGQDTIYTFKSINKGDWYSTTMYPEKFKHILKDKLTYLINKQ